MFETLAYFLSFIMRPCYDLTGNWWLAILLFTAIIKLLLMPLALWCQWNSIVMVRMMPAVNRLKVKYFGDSETIGEKQNELNKQNHYHPLLSLVPLAVQILILFGLVEVIHGITDNGAPGTEFLGMVPIEDGGISWIMPLLAGLSAVALGFAQNRINPLQREQSRAEKNMTNGISIVLSLVLGVFVAAGMAFYWICSNLTAILVQVLCNALMPPSKYIDYGELAASRVELDELNALSKRKTPWYRRDPLAKREKEDYRRFMSIVGKHLVFYSEGSGFYKYFQGAIEWLLTHSDVIIHYVTSDPDDQIFKLAEEQPQIFPYYIGEKRLITLMMKMEADVVVASLEDLDNFYIKRSYVDKNIEYINMCHHMTSMHLVSTKEAFFHYDTVMCVGEHQKTELRRMEELYNLPARQLPEIGYDLIDRQIEGYAKRTHASNERTTILIAPSWQKDCILDLCAHEVIDQLMGKGYKVIVRPHPEYTKRYKPRWNALQQHYESYSSDELYFEQDFSTSDSIYDADVMLTDWSSISCEFAFATLKPVIFINTPMKISNPDWEEVGIVPTDISLRDQIGASLSLDDLGQLSDLIEDMRSNPEKWKQQIEETRNRMIYNQGHGGEAAGQYILGRLLEIQDKKVAQKTNGVA